MKFNESFHTWLFKKSFDVVDTENTKERRAEVAWFTEPEEDEDILEQAEDFKARGGY